MINVIDVAKICHQANKAYCDSIGDISQVDWDEAPLWQKESAINGVVYHLSTSNTKPEDSHINWMQEKIQNGWKYGTIKDPEKKEHPCLVPFNKLPKDQQIKDVLFKNIVDSLKPLL